MFSDPFSPDRFQRSLARARGRRAQAERARTRRRRRVALPSTGLSLLLAATLAAGTFAQLAVGAGSGSGGVRAAHSVPVLKLGSRGTAVKQLQRRLRISADGVFGPQTERAVKRFQRRRGLTADGIVGPATRRALGLRSTGGSPTRPRLTLTQILRRIAQCESGGNPRAVSPNGMYRGKYQFSRQTWRGLGGRGDPARASERLQDRMAAKLYRQVGRSAWPHCAPR